MRLSTDPERRDEAALATITAAVDAGVRVFDTARAYGLGEDDLGHNERAVASALRSLGVGGEARMVTKGGMARPGGHWLPDGRASTIRADCEASLVALDGLPISLYLLHAPDPRTPWRTSVRALGRLVDEGLVESVGVSNVSLTQLDEAVDLAPVAAVQVALNPYDVRALRGGLMERAEERGLTVIAHSPLGGPRRVGGLARLEALAATARELGVMPADVALAWLLDLSAQVVAIPGARRPETARSSAKAAALVLSSEQRARLTGALGGRRTTSRAVARPADGGEVALVMGIPGAGKSRAAEGLVADGYERLNRDERGGTLRELSAAVGERLAAGVRRVVVDNTYLTRASRAEVLEVATSAGLPVRCVWFDTPLAQAQVNLVNRLLDRFGHLPMPEEVRREGRRTPGVMAPTSQMRALRGLEPPSEEEGFVAVERVGFLREPAPRGMVSAVFVSAQALGRAGAEGMLAAHDPSAPHLVFDWRPDGSAADLADVVRRVSALVAGPVEAAVCPHGGGPPVCWCRPPLPGLLLAFARTHRVDSARSTLVGTSGAHRGMAATLGSSFASPL